MYEQTETCSPLGGQVGTKGTKITQIHPMNVLCYDNKIKVKYLKANQEIKWKKHYFNKTKQKTSHDTKKKLWDFHFGI